jgi:hypothetical protein
LREIKRQKASCKGQKVGTFIFSFDFPFGSEEGLKNMAWLPNKLLPFAICLLLW